MFNYKTNINIRVQVANRNRFKIPKKIARGCHLLDPRWNGLLLIICQKRCFYPFRFELEIRNPGQLATRVR